MLFVSAGDILWTVGEVLFGENNVFNNQIYIIESFERITLACKPERLWLLWCGSSELVVLMAMSLCSSEDNMRGESRADNEPPPMLPLCACDCFCCEAFVASFTSWNFSIN